MYDERNLYLGKHRGQRNHALDVVKRNGTPEQPTHSAAPADHELEGSE